MFNPSVVQAVSVLSISVARWPPPAQQCTDRHSIWPSLWILCHELSSLGPVRCPKSSNSKHLAFLIEELRVRPPGIEWKTGRNPKMEKRIGPKTENGPRPEIGKNGPKMAKKWDLGSFFYFFAIFGPFFFPVSGRGPFSIFGPIFSLFWISTRFPFCTRRLDSQ